MNKCVRHCEVSMINFLGSRLILFLLAFIINKEIVTAGALQTDNQGKLQIKIFSNPLPGIPR